MAVDSNALDDDARAARERTLLAEVLETERIEEALIEAAEPDGRRIIRRPDANPIAVLGLAELGG